MAIYSLGVLTTGTGSGAAAWEIRAGASAYNLLELGIFLTAATASTFGVGNPAAIGVTPTSPVTLLQETAQGQATTVQSALAWGTGPTVPANFYRRIQLAAAIGAGVIWQFPRGLFVASSNSIVVWNLAANSALDAYAVIEQ